MSSPMQSELQNRLLSRMPAEDFALIAEFLVRHDYQRGQIICGPDEPIPYALFPESGVVSIVVLNKEGQSVEGGLVGWDGFVHPALLLGTDRIPYRVEIQIAAHGYSLSTEKLHSSTNKSMHIRSLLLSYNHILNVQTSYTAMSNAAYPIEERLARWLLMCHDRSATDEIALTHRFMSVMLAVRRASVTTALQTLEGNGFVKSERGYVTITRRAALEEFAGDAYGRPEAEYNRLIGTN